MVLAIDIGNSRTKIGFFQKDELTQVITTEKFSADFAQQLIADFPSVEKIFYSSVREIEPEVVKILSKAKKTIELTEKVPLPFINKYGTPETLGKDRIAAVAGGLALFGSKNILVIDAGTCITYDLVTDQTEYLGGGISPGLKMRFAAMHNFTGKLPLIKPDAEDKPDLIGSTTRTSIESGVKNGILAEVDGLIDEYKRQFSNLHVIVTGGDYNYFDKYLKNNIFAAPNLVLIGLKKILDIDEDS